jgi:hypothetical protein
MAANDVQGKKSIEQSVPMGRGRAACFQEMSTFCVYLKNRLRTIWSAQRTIHFDYQHLWTRWTMNEKLPGPAKLSV